jgi:hypothetical protein
MAQENISGEARVPKAEQKMFWRGAAWNRGLVGVVLLCSSAICADDPGGWDKVKWGATLDEVRGLYENSQPDAGHPDQIKIPDIKVYTPSFDMQATVRTDAGKVSSVTLSLSDEKLKSAALGRGVAFDIVKRLLIEKYGPPANETTGLVSGLRETKLLWSFPSTSIELLYSESVQFNNCGVYISYRQVRKNPF